MIFRFFSETFVEGFRVAVVVFALLRAVWLVDRAPSPPATRSEIAIPPWFLFEFSGCFRDRGRGGAGLVALFRLLG